MDPTVPDIQTLKVLAKDIASYLSYDASQWRPNWVKSPNHSPVQVFFEFKDDSAPYVALLQSALWEILKQPYLTTEWAVNAPIIMAQSRESADAVIVFQEQVQSDRKRLAYEIFFQDSSDVFPGWFSFER